ncbi:amidohydrolase family protein [Nakamurella sp. A5-74]|uniref:Amidohydrolase family protein n=1 Tax=Nakamurella sp. A5-74 TaxID=3158264 RepID=A0AAU8DP25_9ACTN
MTSDVSSAENLPRAIDTHVHLWHLEQDGPHGHPPVSYSWLGPQQPLLNRTYPITELRPHLQAADVDGIVLVQAASDPAEVGLLLHTARHLDLPARVTAWLPLEDREATVALLAEIDELRRGPDGSDLLRGVRHPIHDDPNPRWMLRPDVARGLDLLAEQGLIWEAVAERLDLLELVPEVARRHPGLTIVLDHLGKPPIAGGDAGRWRDLLAAAAAEPAVLAKISGLGTVSAPGWNSETWQPFVDHALVTFGPDRLMVGGDWPVALLAGDYPRTWSTTTDTLAGLAALDRQAILSGNAVRIYGF